MASKKMPLCFPSELRDIITFSTGGLIIYPTDEYNEVYPGVFLSEGAIALNRSLLKQLGVTHVINAAFGKGIIYVNTNEAFYKTAGIQFLGVHAIDTLRFNLAQHFDSSADFIEDALAQKGKVLVHCKQGVSRSATLVIAFLMIKRGMSVQDAVRNVRKHREIVPNDGFLQQLCDLNEKLHDRKLTI